MTQSFNKSFIIWFVQNVVSESNAKVNSFLTYIFQHILLRFSSPQFHFLFCKVFILFFFEYSFFIALCSCLISYLSKIINVVSKKQLFFPAESLFLPSSFSCFVCFLSLSFILHSFLQCHLLEWGRKADRKFWTLVKCDPTIEQWLSKCFDQVNGKQLCDTFLYFLFYFMNTTY